jgi:hypothetical protein
MNEAQKSRSSSLAFFSTNLKTSLINRHFSVSSVWLWLMMALIRFKIATKSVFGTFPKKKATIVTSYNAVMLKWSLPHGQLSIPFLFRCAFSSLIF